MGGLLNSLFGEDRENEAVIYGGNNRDSGGMSDYGIWNNYWTTDKKYWDTENPLLKNQSLINNGNVYTPDLMNLLIRQKETKTLLDYLSRWR